MSFGNVLTLHEELKRRYDAVLFDICIVIGENVPEAFQQYFVPFM